MLPGLARRGYRAPARNSATPIREVDYRAPARSGCQQPAYKGRPGLPLAGARQQQERLSMSKGEVRQERGGDSWTYNVVAGDHDAW
ncbi:hypothetical protein BHM03_00019581 [Ensete ventricosum]|nr:hypothetical protein BHM03_00019581 [Ensete ventricosum]